MARLMAWSSPMASARSRARACDSGSARASASATATALGDGLGRGDGDGLGDGGSLGLGWADGAGVSSLGAGTTNTVPPVTRVAASTTTSWSCFGDETMARGTDDSDNVPLDGSRGGQSGRVSVVQTSSTAA